MDSTIVAAGVTGALGLSGVIFTSVTAFWNASRARRTEAWAKEAEQRAHAHSLEVAELRAEREAMRAEREAMDDRYEHLVTVLQADADRARSERDSLREENLRLRVALKSKGECPP